MISKAYYLIAVGVIAALAFTPAVYAHGSGAGSWGGFLMGGPEYAMMGGQGMMGLGPELDLHRPGRGGKRENQQQYDPANHGRIIEEAAGLTPPNHSVALRKCEG